MSAVPTQQLIDHRYRLIHVLGSGGAGIVHRARDERLGRDVAVKLFHRDCADPARQSAELSVMASLTHPALVRMYDGGRLEETPGVPGTYLVMEFVPGTTLHDALHDGPLRGAMVAGIGASLAAALDHLHRRGIVHRDVKPANVLLPSDGHVAAKLGDFGIARALDSTRITATGATIGTLAYLSPEQALAQAVGPSSDVYALGLVLLEALTGEPAFRGDGLGVALARLDADPDIPASLGQDWTKLLTAMSSRNPRDRPSAAEILGVLRRMVGSTESDTARSDMARTVVAPAAPRATVLASPTTRRFRRGRPAHRPRFLPLAGAAVAASILSGLVVTVLTGSGTHAPAAPPQPSTSTTATVTRPTAASHPVAAPATSSPRDPTPVVDRILQPPPAPTVPPSHSAPVKQNLPPAKGGSKGHPRHPKKG